MDRTRALIVGMATLTVILAIALAFMIGRQSASADPGPSVANRATTGNGSIQVTTRPVTVTPPAGDDTDDALSRWLAGGWAEEASNCQTDSGDYYNPSGRYGTSGREGLWRIEHGELVVTVTHEAVGDPMAEDYVGLPNPETQRFRVARESQDRMIQIVDGRPVRMMRCPAAHHSFAT